MSRVGKKIIDLPANVTIEIEPNLVRVKGPKGELSQTIHPEMQVLVKDNSVVVKRPNDEPYYRALHGLTQRLIANMVEGVSQGFSRTLEIVGVGYRAALKGSDLELSVGYSHPIVFKKIPGIDFEVPNASTVIVKGIDKQMVGEVAAKIRAIRGPEPYKGKGIKYSGEFIKRKAGKAGKA